MIDGITTAVLYHPSRPLKCLQETLHSLNDATRRRHIVELYVQGTMPPHVRLPAASSFRYELRIIRKAKNLGVAAPLHETINRLETSVFAKLDDDIVVPPTAWDLLLECIDNSNMENAKHRVVAGFISPGQMSPRLFRIEGNKLLMRDGCHQSLERAGRTWDICDYTGLGATVVCKEAFDAGVNVDPGYFVAGENLDFCYQLFRLGLRIIHMRKPRCKHKQKDCMAPSYAAVRWNRNIIADSAMRFYQKWKLKNPQLWKAANLPV